MRRRRVFSRFALTASLAALAVSVSASPAPASVTIGQVVDPNVGHCEPGVDLVQLGVGSGNQYVVPGTGTISSWTTQAGPDGGALALKVFRKVGDPARFQVVGHTDPQTLTPGGTAGNTFPVNIRVKRGDLLGLHTSTDSSCGFKDPAGQHAVSSGDLPDGGVTDFHPEAEFDLDIQAVFVPDNAFRLGNAVHNKKKGTAFVPVDVPNAGELAISGKGIQTGTPESAVSPGKTQVLIKAKGKTLRKLMKIGTVKVSSRITYTPTGGEASTRSMELRLRRL